MKQALQTFLIALVTALLVHYFLGPWSENWELINRSDDATPAVVEQVEKPTESPFEKTEPEEPVKQQPPKLAAPNLEGTLFEAAKTYWGAKGVKIIEDGERTDPSVPPGTIVQQRPTAGEVLTTMEIHAIVATAGEPVRVPMTLGLPLENAQALLVEAGFEVPSPTFEASRKSTNTVIKQVPNPGATIKKGSVVRLVVAKQVQVEVPKLVGSYLRKATKKLEEAGLELGIVRRVEHEELGQNYVLRQSPEPGEKVAPGTVIDLVVVAPN